MEAEQRAAENPAQGSNEESRAMALVLANRSYLAGGPYWAQLDHHLIAGASQWTSGLSPNPPAEIHFVDPTCPMQGSILPHAHPFPPSSSVRSMSPP